MMRAALSTSLSIAFATTLAAQDPFDDLPGFDDEGPQTEASGPRVTGIRGFLETRGRVFVTLA